MITLNEQEKVPEQTVPTVPTVPEVPLAEAARLLGVSTKTVWRRIRLGLLVARKEHGEWLVQVKDGQPGQNGQSLPRVSNLDREKLESEMEELLKAKYDQLRGKEREVHQLEEQMSERDGQIDFLRTELGRRDEEIKEKNKQIEGLNERIKEAHFLAAQQRKLLPEPGKKPWWQFWRRGKPIE